MGSLAAYRGGLIYLDTNVFIYAVEGVAEHAAFIDKMFLLLDAGELIATTSELTLAEVLTKPFELSRTAVVDICQEMLVPSHWLSMVPVSRNILVEAARLRAALKIRLPDAIHLCSAAEVGCTAFVSNDRRLKMPSGLTHVLLD